VSLAGLQSRMKAELGYDGIVQFMGQFKVNEEA